MNKINWWSRYNRVTRATMNLVLVLALVAISFGKPAKALYPFKLIQNASHAIALSPEEWASEFQCNTEEVFPLMNDTTSKPQLSPPLDCYRDKNAWLYKHVDEVQDKFKFLVHQESIDARFADSVYLTNGHTGLDFHHYKFNSGDPKQDALNLQSVAGPEVNDEACRRHLKQMVDLVDDLASRVDLMRRRNDTSAGGGLGEAHFRLARVLDSFGRYESGQLGGRYHSFGLYDQCISTPLMLGANGAAESELVGSRYCWARLNLDRHLSRPLRGEPHGNSSHIASYFTGDFKFHMAICLPRSCHSATFANEENRDNLRLVQRLIDTQYRLPKAMYLDEGLPLESVFCLVDDESQVAKMPLGGKLFITFVLVWTLVCIGATYKRRAKHNVMLDDFRAANNAPAKKSTSLWSQLDLFESWQEFLGERELSRLGERVNLDPLNFVKWFCTLLVVVTHANVLAGPLTLAHIRLGAIMETYRLESLSLFGFVLVDSFFVITGMMMSYIFLRRVTAYERRETAKLEQQLPPMVTTPNLSIKQRNLFARNLDLERDFSPLGASFHKACMTLSLTRYLRLVPLLFLAFWFKKSVYPYLGSGPMWDYGLNRDTSIGGCLEESWITPFTFRTAYLPGAQQCLPQTWTISNDIFFSLMMPPIIVLLYKWPRSAFVVSGVNIVLSLYLGKLTYDRLDPHARFEIEQLRDHSVVIMFQVASYMYTIPLYRVPAITVGILSGYILFKYSQWDGNSRAGNSKLRGTGIDAVELSENGAVATNDGETRSGGKWPDWFSGWLTYISIAIVLLVLLLSLFTPEIRRHTDQETKRSMFLYILLYYHLIWSLANGVLFLRLVTDKNNHFITRLFASRFFSTAGKLSYAILLFHWDLLMYDLHIETQGLEFSRWNYFGSMALAYLAAIPVAIVVFVVFENPLDKLTKTYLLPNKRRQV